MSIGISGLPEHPHISPPTETNLEVISIHSERASIDERKSHSCDLKSQRTK